MRMSTSRTVPSSPDSTAALPPHPASAAASCDATGDDGAQGAELARGAGVNALAIVASNLRGIFTFLIARLLGSAAVGVFAVAWAVADTLSKFSVFGLDTAIVALVARRNAVGDRAGARRLLVRSVSTGLVLSVVTAALGILAYRVIGPWLGQPEVVVVGVTIILLALPGITVYRISNGVSRGMRVMRHDIYSRGFAESLVTLGAFLLAYTAGWREHAPMWAVVVGTSAGAVVAFWLARRLLPAIGPAAVGADAPSSGPVTGPMLRFAAPMAGYGLLNILMMRMDVLLLSTQVDRIHGLDVASFGVYCAAVEIAGVMRKVRQAFDPIFMPVVAASTERRDHGALELAAGQVSRWVLAVLLPLLGVMSLAAGLLLGIFGRDFVIGANWVVVLLVAHGIGSLGGLAETVIGVSRPRLNLINSALVVVAQVAVTLALISRWGPIGAALGMLLAYTALAVLRYVHLRWLFGWRWPLAAMRRPITAFGLAMGPALTVRWLLAGWPGAVAAAATLVLGYVLAWWRLGLEPADRDAYARLLRPKR